MKGFVWRAKSGWVYLVGITLMLGFSALAYGEVDIKTAKENREASKQESQGETLAAGNVKGAQTGVSESSKPTTTTKPEEKKTKTKTIYKTVTVDQSRTVTSTPSAAAEPVTATKPPVKRDIAKLNVVGVGSYKVDVKKDDTVFDVLNRARAEYGFVVDYTMDETWGAFVTKIGSIGYSSSLGFNSPDNSYWFLYMNGASAQEGVSFVKVYDNDLIEWRYEKSPW